MAGLAAPRASFFCACTAWPLAPHADSVLLEGCWAFDLGAGFGASVVAEMAGASKKSSLASETTGVACLARAGAACSLGAAFEAGAGLSCFGVGWASLGACTGFGAAGAGADGAGAAATGC